MAEQVVVECDCDPDGPEYHCNSCGMRYPSHATGCICLSDVVIDDDQQYSLTIGDIKQLIMNATNDMRVVLYYHDGFTSSTELTATIKDNQLIIVEHSGS